MLTNEEFIEAVDSVMKNFEQSGRQEGKTLRYKLETTIIDDNTIRQEVFDSLTQKAITTLNYMIDEQLRQALIRLGWTPPEETK